MGYYTEYRLTVEGEALPDERLEEIRKALVEISGYHDSTFRIWEPHCNEISTPESIKWYDHQADLITLSEKFPGLRLSLHCIGEDGAQHIIDALDGLSDWREGEMVFKPRSLWED